MAQNVTGAVICAGVGFLVAFMNYILSKKILETRPEKFAFTTVFRQLVQVGYLMAVYFIGSKADVSLTYLLVGAVIGMTVPMFFFTKKLIAFNENLTQGVKDGEEDENG